MQIHRNKFLWLQPIHSHYTHHKDQESEVRLGMQIDLRCRQSSMNTNSSNARQHEEHHTGHHHIKNGRVRMGMIMVSVAPRVTCSKRSVKVTFRCC